jgi:hypothetical protein
MIRSFEAKQHRNTACPSECHQGLLRIGRAIMDWFGAPLD